MGVSNLESTAWEARSSFARISVTRAEACSRATAYLVTWETETDLDCSSL